MTKGITMKKNNQKTKLVRNTSLVITALALYGCVPQKNYQQPQIDLPQNYRTQEQVQNMTDSVGLGAVQWKDFFEDKELIDLIQAGLDYNFDLKKALNNLEIAHLSAAQAKLEWLPSVNMELGGVNAQYRSKNYYSNPSSKYYAHYGKDAPENMYMKSIEYTSDITAKWEIDIWGKIKSQSAAQLAGYLQTNEAKNAIQTALIASIAKGYYNLLLLDAQMEVAKSNYQLTENTLKIVILQRDAGQLTSLAIQQTKNQMLLAKALIPTINSDISIQENALSLLTGALPHEIRRDTKLSAVPMQLDYQIGVPLRMVANRPDVQGAQYNLQAKNALVGVTQTSRYPSLTIGASLGLNSMLTKNWFNIPGSLFGDVIGGLTTPLFNKKRLKTAYEIAKIEREQAEIDFQKTVYTAMVEVSDALNSLQTVDKQIEIAEEQVSTSRLGVKQSNLLFNSGYATYIEVINAQKNMLDSELNLNKFKQKKLLIGIDLYKSLGGGIQ